MPRKTRAYPRFENLLVFFLGLVCVVAVVVVEAADGDLDPSLGSDGKVTTDFNGSNDRAFAIAIQNALQIDGKIVLAGYTASGSATDFALARYLSSASAPAVDLSLTMFSESPDPLTAGSNLTYIVSATNNGPDPATGVTITDTLPSGVTFVSASTSCSQSSGTVTCNLGTLSNGETAIVTLTVQTNTAGTITNAATVTGNEPDPDTANNTATQKTTITPPTGTLLGPTPYLSQNDSPFLGSISVGTTLLETFEDGLLNTPGVMASTGSVTGPGGNTDSVDGDDGIIDGSGTNGRSFFSGNGAAGITFTFDAAALGGQLPRQAGIVWTDAGVGSSVTFEAFDANNLSLGTLTAPALADNSNSGTTAEDRFFGVTNQDGIGAIKISNTSGGIEVDHLQYGQLAALPQSVAISGRVVNLRNVGLAGVGVFLTGTQNAFTETDVNGNYSFVNLPAGGSYTVTPSGPEVVFTPQNRTFSGLLVNQTGADFVVTRQVSVATPAGSNVTVQFLDDGITLTFANVTRAGITTLRDIDATSVGALPVGYSLADTVGVDISTTATTKGPITGCTILETGNNFANLRILHGENGVLVDRTSSSDPATLTICATVDSLSPFILAQVQSQTISGNVIDSAERALAGVTVSLSGTQQGFTTTDSSGNYSFTVLTGGNYTVTPSRTNFIFDPQSLVFQRLNVDVTNANFIGSFVNFSIIGRVTDAGGNGIPSVTMTLAGAGAETKQTDANGNYTFTQIAAGGDYLLTPTKLGFDFAPPSQTFNNVSSNQAANFTGTPQPSPTPTPTLSKNFDDGTIGPNFTPGLLTNPSESTNPNVTVTVINGQLVITPLSGVNGLNFNGVVLISPIDLTVTPIVSIEAVKVPIEEGALTTFALGNDRDNWYRFAAGTDPALENLATKGQEQTDGPTLMLFFQTNLGGTKFSTGIPYDAVAHRFWRFRFEAFAQTINFETSPDAVVWTLRYTSNISKPVTALTAELSAGTIKTTLNPDVAIFDNFVVSDEDVPGNRIDQTGFFVRQQYLDFLNREPDPEGFAYWMDQIQSCGSDLSCIHSRRIGVSGAFFVEPEFQQTGTFVYLLYKAAFNRQLTFAEFQSDRSLLVVGPNLEDTKSALAQDFVARPAFRNIYDRLNSIDYVDALYANAGIVPTPEQRAFLVIGLLTQQLTRGDVLFLLAESQAFAQREFNSVFVLMEYFGYLRRDPDEEGYVFWLDVINNREPNNYRGMICAFITSTEYQLRFGSNVTRSNADCATQ